MINKIKELLHHGKVIELECINEEEFLKGHPTNKDVLSKPIIVCDSYINGDLKLEGWNYLKNEELKYFKVKNMNKQIKYIDWLSCNLCGHSPITVITNNEPNNVNICHDSDKVKCDKCNNTGVIVVYSHVADVEWDSN